MAQAASIGLGIGGAIISTALGAGPAIGFLAGSTIGTLVFGTMGADEVATSGPRLSDLSVTSSAYGRTIPIILGTARIGGNVVVSSDKIETKKTQSIGKGNPLGGGAEAETFYYRVHFFWAACRGDGTQKLLRIYADKKLIFDATDSAISTNDGEVLGGLNVVQPDFEFRWLPGGPTQLVDPQIESLIGENNSPAYRQVAGIMFEDFKLEKYGNRVPQIEAVISSVADDAYPTVAVSFLNDQLNSYQTNAFAIDWRRKRWIADDATGTEGWHIMDSDSMEELFEVLESEVNADRPATVTGTGLGAPLAINAIDGSIVCNGDGGNASPVFRIDPDTYRITHQFGADGTGLSFGPTSFQTLSRGACASAISLLGTRTFFLCSGVIGDSIGILDADVMEYLYHTDLDDIATSGDPAIFIPVAPQEDQAICYILTGGSLGYYSLFKVAIDYNARYAAPIVGEPEETFGVEVTHVKDFTTATYTGSTNRTITGGWWDESDDTIMIQWDNSSSGCYMLKYDPNDDVDVWYKTYTGGFRARPSYLGSQYDIIRDNRLAWFNDTSRHLTQIDTRNGEVIYEVDNTTAGGWLDGSNNNQMSYNSSQDAIVILASRKIYIGRLAEDSITLQEAVETILDNAGYESTEYDMSAFSGITFPGYILSRPSNARQYLEQLSSAFFFSIVESDYVLKGVLKSNPDTVAITQDDLGQVSGELEGVPLTIDRIQEEELPGEVTLLHSEPTRDYQTGTQHVKRVSLPNLYTMQSDHNMVVEMPIMLEATDARQMAEKMMFTAWVERNLYQLVLPWKYLALDPADVITLTMDDGTTHSIRATQVDLGANMTIEVRGVSHDTPSFTSTISGSAGDGFKNKTLFTTVPTELFIMQTPLLRDEDDLNRTGTVFYAAAGARSAAWTGAFLYESPDAAAFTQIDTFVNDVVWGSTIGILADAPDGLWNVFDNENTIDVRIISPTGTLSSVTYDALFAAEDVNACLIGDEIVRFMTATDNGDGTYTLSGLLRGRRGTDYAVDRHETPGERFIFLDPTKISIIEHGLGVLGESRYYKAVSVGESLADVYPTPVTMEGADLKPYAPENIQRDDDSSDPDIVVTWVRRTRIDSEFRDGTDVAPLNEDSEEYAAYILSAAYDPDTFDPDDSSTYVRAYTGLTTETFTYTDAEQTTDGFDKTMDPLYVVIFQVSTQAGLGWPGDATLYGPDAIYFTLIGENGAGTTTGADWPTNNTLWNQYTMTGTGAIERIDVYFSGNSSGSNIRVAVYRDTGADLPGALVTQETSSVSPGHPLGFTEITLSTPAAVSAGEKIWLAVQVDTSKNGAAGSPVVTPIQRQRSGVGYGSGMPDPAGSTATYLVNRSMRCLLHIGA